MAESVRAVAGAEPPGAAPADAATEPGAVAADDDAAARPGWWHRPLLSEHRLGLWTGPLASTRARLLVSYLLLLALAGVVATFSLRQLLVIRLDDRIDDDLRQEILEFERLLVGRDPDTAEPFESLGRVFDVFFRRNVTGEDEALAAFVGGRLHDQRITVFPLDRIPEDAIAQWAAFSQSGRRGEQLVGTFDTSRGSAKFRAVRVGTERDEGAFVVTILPVTERAEIRELQLYTAVIAFVVVLIAAAFAWFLAGRVVAPVRALTVTARSISETDLTRRIRVGGSSEAAEMAETFNAMLDRLEAVYRSQLEFLRAAGHELRTPLTVATGHLDVVGDDPDERRETIALVQDELGRMARIVDDLHSLAEAVHPDFLVQREVDLAQLAHDLLAKARTLGDRDWRLEHAAPGTLFADPDRLAQAVLNLADNAVKNTEPDDTIAIGVGIRSDDVHIWVRDTGPGVSPADAERIFGRFVRGGTAHERYRGAGLGLAIVSTIAEAHGGRVELDSPPGQGARFSIIVPWVRGPWRAS